jgi:Cu(I)/Ag(I) efflux system membrane fusion protein
MAASSRKTVGWLVALSVLVALVAAIWYAQARGWLDAPYAWVRRQFTGHAESGNEHAGMGMSMPGMDMGSVASDESSGVPGHAPVALPGEVRQRIGVTTGRVEKAPLRMAVRVVGIVRPDETKVAHVHLRTEGWVHELGVSYTGQSVKKGDPLLTIYSPQFLTTQQEYLNARQGKQTDLARLARQRLELWGVPADEIDELGRTGKPRTFLALRTPITGTVLEKNAFIGQYVTPQTDLYVVADLSTVWVQAQVYEYELPHVTVGMPARVALPALPGREFAGQMVFVQPTVEEKTRTAQVRIELPNKYGLLKPGMFAHVAIEHDMGTGLLVPASAVLRTGERDIAYRVAAEGRFVPVEVEIGLLRFGDRFHVLKGLAAGEAIVTSANFLIDSESRLRGGGGMMNMPGMDMGGGRGAGQDKGGMKGMEMKGHGHGGMKGMDTKGMGNDHSKMKH